MVKLFKSKLAYLYVLPLALLFIYYPSFNSGFKHDDIANLASNPSVQIDSLTLDSLSKAATSSDSGMLKRPVSMLSFALNYYFFGDEPYSFKVTNLLLHIITCILVFIFAIQVKKLSRPNYIISSNRKFIYFGLACAFIWAIHPVHISTVAYIVQRMTILSALFSLASITFYLAGRDQQLNYKRNGISYYIFSIICIVIGMLCKENAILVIPLILVSELLFIQPKLLKEDRLYKNKLVIYSCIIALVLSLAFILPVITEYLVNQAYRSRDFTLAERMMTQLRMISLYIKWFYFPNLTELGLFHDDIKLSTSFFNPVSTLLSAIFLLAVCAIAVFLHNKATIIAFGIYWYFIGHILESTIIPLEIAYEHRNYLPYIGLVLASVEGVFLIYKKLSIDNKLMILFVSTILIILSALSIIRTSQWSSPLSFAIYEAAHHPNSVRANHNLGMMYRALTLQGQNNFKDNAYNSLSKASELESKYIQPEAALIQFSYEMNERISPNVINSMAKKLSNYALKLDHINLLRQLVLCHNQECILPKDAAEFLLNSAEKNSRLEEYDLNYSIFMSTYAHFFIERGYDPKSAEPYFKKAIAVSPHHIQNYTDYANLLILLGRKEEATLYLNKALSMTENSEYKDEILELMKSNNL